MVFNCKLCKEIKECPELALTFYTDKQDIFICKTCIEKIKSELQTDNNFNNLFTMFKKMIKLMLVHFLKKAEPGEKEKIINAFDNIKSIYEVIDKIV